MQKKEWTSIDEGKPFEKLKADGYVIKITGIEDVPARSYLNIVFDIAEGPNAGYYSDQWAQDNPWAHRFVRSYKQSAEGMFKNFLQRLQDSNEDFDIEVWERNCDERDFVGLKLGVVLQYEDYTNQRGEDKERLQVVGVYSADYIRDGKFKVPARADKRTSAASAPAAAAVPAYDKYPVPGGIHFEPGDGKGSNDDLPFA